MTYKLVIVFLLTMTVGSTFGQTKVKKDLYLYFEADSAKSLKQTRLNEGYTRRGKVYLPVEYETYGIKYISNDKESEIYDILFLNPNKNVYCVIDSNILKSKKVVPYKDLRGIKGIYEEVSDKKRFPYRKLFIVEQIEKNQYKVVEVQSYIGSDDRLFRRL
ncbi:hypothetical protein [Pedobacter steynii]